jgi:signal transduction histidine kinase
MKISTKLTLGYLIAAALIAIIGGVSLYGILSISNCFNELLDSTSQEIPTLEKLSAQFFNMRLESTACIAILEHKNGLKKPFSLQKEDNKEHLTKNSSLDMDELFVEKIAQFQKTNDSAKELIALYLSYTPGFNEPIADSLERVRVLHEQVFNQVLALGREYSNNKSTEILKNLEKAEEEHTEKMTDALKDETDFAKKEGEEAELLVLHSKWLIGVISVFTMALSAFLGVSLAQHISRPLSLLTDATEKLGQGNYDSKVKIVRSDEIGKLAVAYNTMVDELEHAKILEQQKKQLEILNDELNRKNEALDNFVYRVSHDLKAPIVNISSLIALMQKKWVAPDQRLTQTMGYIADSTVKLQQTIYDLLELARLERKIEKNQEKIELSCIISGVKESLRGNINAARGKIETDFKQAPSFIFPKIDIESIMSNLISNAIKYAQPDVPPVVFIGAKKVDAFICITVSDNGMGIDLEKHGSKLYGMFMRFHDHVEGSGVGLFITRKLVTDAHGKLEIDSKVGKGTTFRIYLPLKPIVVEEIAFKNSVPQKQLELSEV